MTEADRTATTETPAPVKDALWELEDALTAFEGLGRLLITLSCHKGDVEASALNPVASYFEHERARADAAFKVLFPVMLDALEKAKAA